MQDRLDVEGEEEKDSEHAHPHREGGQIGAGSIAVSEHAKRQQRVGGVRLDDEESRQQHDAQPEGSQRGRGRPAVRVGAGETVNNEEQAAGDGDCPRQIKGSRAPDVMAVQQPGTACVGDDGQDDVDVKAPPPGQVFGQEPAEQQPDCRAGPGDRSEDAEGLAAFTRLHECRCQQGKQRRRQEGGEGSLHGACAQQGGEVAGRPAEGGSTRKSHQANEKYAPTPKDVGGSAPQQ